MTTDPILAHDPPPIFSLAGRLTVLRDDRLPGGTKRRFLTPMLAAIPEPEIVYAGPSEGYAQLALGHAARDTGHRVAYFHAARAEDHPLVKQGRALGVQYHGVKPGYLTVVEKRAAQYVAEAPTERVLMPLGFHTPAYHTAAVHVIQRIATHFPTHITDIWIAWGSGLLATAIRDACPHLRIHAVVVGRKPTEPPHNIDLHYHPDPFTRRARITPPYPSAANYDAKVWAYADLLGGPSHLIWNVGA